MKIAVIIPAYNEAKRIASVLSKIPKEIEGNSVLTIVVDDGSRDETSKVAKETQGIKVIRHRTNLGKGAAVKTGCDAASSLGADIFVLIDSDGQHRPEDISPIVKPIIEGKASLVVGTRKFSKDMPLTMRLGNTTISMILKLMFGIKAKDTQSGFRAFNRSVYPLVRWAAPHYAMETEMLILAARHKVQIAEVYIDTIYLDNYKGTTPLDGLKILKTALKWKLLWSQEYKSLESFSV